MKTLTVLMLVLGAASVPAGCLATAPQSPFAAGPIKSVAKAVRKAHRCGIRKVRVVEEREEGRASAFFPQGLSRDKEMCVMHWMTQHGAELKFEPRWYKDDFTEDWPT